MEVCDIKTIESPEDPNRVRACAQLVYDDDHPDEQLWFEFDQAYADQISNSGNPWLACLLPTAAATGQPLKICRPVDPLLLQNARELLRIWDCWYDFAHVIDIDVETQQPVGDDPQHTASLFSGGVDAFFNVLHAEHPGPNEPTYPIDDLINLRGFDIEIDEAEVYSRLLKKLRQSSAELGKNLIETSTNYYVTRSRLYSPKLGFGGVLSSVGLLLEKRIKRILIGSSHGYRDLYPQGSHPLIDPLRSTANTQIIHYGSAYSRTDKTAFIAKSKITLQRLRVCGARDQVENCGACNKCYRTMITLDILGVLDQATAFKKNSLTLNEIEHIYSPSAGDRVSFEDILRLAKEKRQPKVAEALERSLKYSDLVNRRLAWVEKIPNIVLGEGRQSWKRPAPIRRVVWLLRWYLRKWILRHALCSPYG